jgi:hypothetical protein
MNARDRREALARLLARPADKRLSPAAQFVADNRTALRRLIRRGHSLSRISTEVGFPKRTLQKQLNLAGLFFRKPRRRKGAAIRPYKRRTTASKK